MVLDRKTVACPLRVCGETLPQVWGFKYLGALFTGEGQMEHWCLRYQSVEKKDLS